MDTPNHLLFEGLFIDTPNREPWDEVPLCKASHIFSALPSLVAARGTFATLAKRAWKILKTVLKAAFQRHPEW